MDWALFFSENYASDVKLIHRSDNFRAHNDSVQRALDYSKQGKIKMILNSQVSGISKNKNKITLDVQSKNNDLSKINCDNWLPLFGLTPKIGPIGDSRNSKKCN